MTRNLVWPLAIAFLFAPVSTGYAQTEPEPSADAPAEAGTEAGAGAPAEEPATTGEDFAKGLIGTTYSGNFEIDGWTDQGGGLVLPPIYVHHYNRENGTILVVTAKELDAAEAGSGAKFEVTDTLLADKPHKGYTFSTSCMKGDDYTLRFMGEVSGKDAAEWWTNLRKGWEIDIETGKISEIKARGVQCTNPNW